MHHFRYHCAPFAKYWMHNGYINVDNRKMSKSLNNFFTVRDVAEKYGYEAIRYMLISSHYRSPINYSEEIIDQCIRSLSRIHNCYDNLKFALENAEGSMKENESEAVEKFLSHKEKFLSSMDDDLNTADAISAIFELARDINTYTSAEKSPSRELCEKAMEIFTELNDVIGVITVKEEQSLSEQVEELIKKRSEARKNKDWATADAIRDELRARSIVLEDTPNGIKWHIDTNMQ